MSAVDRVGYDEFGMLHENASEVGLVLDRLPHVERVWVDVGDGRELSALVWGDGPPELVLLHGGAQNAHTWDTVCLALGDRSIVAIDLPGHGHSADIQEGAGTPPGAAADVAAALRSLVGDTDGARLRAVVGMSLGGLVSIALAGLDPELVPALLLVDILPGIKAEHGRHIADFVAGPPSFPSFDELLARTVEHNPHRTVSSLRRGILHNAAQQPDGSWAWRHTRGNGGLAGRVTRDVGPDDRLYESLWSTLESLPGPVLLARGLRADSVLRDEDVAELHRRVPPATVVPFPDAGHSLQGDTPLALAATITDFIS
ncbi:MAG TPA: alpha/beta hydrolase [Acidimicrobiales bacterium]|nr:alpha/beta hydrolase [Acidimicrobiales bacterium]